MLRLHLDGSDENVSVYLDFFLPACKYAEMIHHKDSPEEKEVVLILKEVMDKLAKVGIEKNSVKESIEKTEKLLIKHSANGTDSVGTHELAGRIENYLAQGKGALDVFSNQYLVKAIGFPSKWHHEKLIEFLKSRNALRILSKTGMCTIKRILKFQI